MSLSEITEILVC